MTDGAWESRTVWDLAVNGKTPFPIKGLDQ